MNDIQTETILKRAKNLNAVLQNPLAKKVLEVDLKTESSKNQDLLNRVIRSLEQYVNKEREIIYVGFVGHFSSGKSSTINSLLELNNSSAQRETGLNPTDKAITLITHPKNSNALVLMNREGGLVPVRTTFLEIDVLKNMVLSDTPGSGDPQVVNEMIQDFLPICDIIFYFISAANPIDQADLPLLQQKTTKLPFIPIQFIITRTDEFRSKKTLPITNDNFDLTKRDTFLGKLIARIKQILRTEEVFLEDFVFIDNESSFNIELLKQKLIEAGKILDQQSLIKMHGHKVEYYRANLNAIYKYYINSIDEKILQSKGYLKTAGENISRFDRSIEMNNEKLRLLWVKSENSFKEAFQDEKRALEEISYSSFPTHLSNDRQIQAERRVVNINIENQANGHLGKVMLDLNGIVRQRVRDIKHSILDNITSGEVQLENISHLFSVRLDFDSPSHSIEIDFSRVNESVRQFSERITSILNEIKGILRIRISQVKTHSNKDLIFNCLRQNYENGKAAIFENFDQYFERIQMYRSTVLTRNTKETIEKLRIGTQLDELDDDFEDDFVSEMKGSTVDQVYVNCDKDVNELKALIESLLSRLADVKNQMERISIQKKEASGILVKENIDISVLLGDLLQQREELANIIYQEKLGQVFENHRTKFNTFRNSLDLLRKERRRKIWKWSLIVGFVLLLTYVCLVKFDIVTPSTLTYQLIIGLGTTAIGNFLGYLYASLKNDIKKMSVKTSDQFKKDTKSELLQLFGESFWDDLTKRMTDEKLQGNVTFIKDKFNSKVSPILTGIIESEQLVLNNLLDVNKQLNQVLAEFRQAIERFYAKFSVIFIDTDKNLERISKITKHIKEVSIKPSFDLLNETTFNLEQVKVQIEEIKG